MNPIESYDKIKNHILRRVNTTINWLDQGEELGISFEEEKLKLINLKNNLDDSKLKIALVGAFSEGKTTMVASWLGKIEDDMKIHHEESSDAISLYSPQGLEDKCVIVDTPGLFGNKEIEIEENLVKYKEITEKYVSEAHLILYVINPVNLLKDSHKDTCKWLFRNLGKLKNTVFVINRFDDIADLEDQDEFYNQFSIKKTSFINTLDRFINLNEEEKSGLNIIAIAANPYAEGLDNWFKKKEEFETISRINSLRSITDNIISNSSPTVYIDQIKSVVSDVILRRKEDIIGVMDLQTQNIEISDKNLKSIKSDLDNVSKEISTNYSSLKREIFSFLADVKIKIRNSDSDTLSDFFEREIGENGKILDLNLEEILNRYIDINTSELRKLGAKIEDELNFSEKIADKYLKDMVGKGLSSVKFIPVSNMRNIVFASRNGIVKTVNSLGGDIALKFKPWGAIKLAKGIGSVAVGLTAVMELWSLWSTYKSKKKFDEAKKSLIGFIEEIDTFYTKMFDNEIEFKETYFPQVKDFSTIHESLKKENENMRSMKKKVEDWFKESTYIQDIKYDTIN